MISRTMGVWAVGALVAFGCGPEADERDASPAAVPDRVVLVDASCDGCTLDLEEIAVLGGPDDPVAFRDDAATRDCMVGRGPGGDFLVTGLIGGGQVAHYRADGTFSHTFGRRGQGPGELGSDIRISVGPGDSIVLIDGSQARVGIYDWSGGFSRSFPIPTVGPESTRRRDGNLVFAQTPATADDPVFTVWSRSGQPLGAVSRPGDRDETVELDTWVVSSSADGGLWAASIWKYEIFHIGADGLTDRVVEREASWFPRGSGYQDGMPITVRPPAVIRFVREIRPGLLLVAAVVPDQAWEPDISLRPSYEWGRRAFDTRIEIIDIEAGSVLASTVLDEWVGAVCDSPLMYTVFEGQDLTLRLRVVRPDLP